MRPRVMLDPAPTPCPRVSAPTERRGLPSIATVVCAAAALALWSALFVELTTSGKRVEAVRLGSAVPQIQEAVEADAGPAHGAASEVDAATAETAWNHGLTGP